MRCGKRRSSQVNFVLISFFRVKLIKTSLFLEWISDNFCHGRLRLSCIADSLRILQHVETLSIPNSWDSLHSKSWKEISWNNKHFEVCEFLKLYLNFALSCCHNDNTGFFMIRNAPGRSREQFR